MISTVVASAFRFSITNDHIRSAVYVPTDFEMVDGGARYYWHDYTCNRTVISN